MAWGRGVVARVELLILLFSQFFSIFRILFAFFSHSYASIAFLIDFFRFRSHFGGVWDDFGRVWGGFFDDCLMIFSIFLKNTDFVKYSVFPRENHYFQGIEAFQLHKKSIKNRQKIDANLE